MGVAKSEESQFDAAKGKLSKEYDLGNVRHPKRLIKIYRKMFYRVLGVNIRDENETPIDGPGTVYISEKSEAQVLESEGDRRKRFQDKWIHFNYLDGKDQQWYIYDPISSDNINIKDADLVKRDQDQVETIGISGFRKVDQVLVDENDKIKDAGGYEIRVIDEDLLNCTFGYNYDQAAMQISITLSNDKGKNKGVYKSGDVIKVYMWYDRNDDPIFTSDVQRWAKNTVLSNYKTHDLFERQRTGKAGSKQPTEDLKFRTVRQKFYETEKEAEENNKKGTYSHGVVLMFTGTVDDTGYDYSKQGGNKLIIKGRSLGAILNAVRIYKSYPNEGRITMPHEEVIYDMVSSQVGLPFGHLILDKLDWMSSTVPPPGKRENGTVLGINELRNTTGSSDINDVNRKQLDEISNKKYPTAVHKGIKDQEKEWIDNIGIVGIVELSSDFVSDVFKEKDISSTSPANNGKDYDPKDESSITEAELEGKGSVSPLWIYSDMKTGKTYSSMWPNNTSLKTIFIDLQKLGRKLPVELKSEHWAEYSIRVPQPIKRDGKSVSATRLFFLDGWNAVKYVMQQTAVVTSAERATKIQALMTINDPEIKWEDLKAEQPQGNKNAIWPKKQEKGFGEGKYILYQVPAKPKEGLKFNVIEFAKELNVITADEVKPSEEKTLKNKRKNGSFKLVEEAIKKDNPDALLRIKLFYKTVRQLTRAFHDLHGGEIPLGAYPNTDSLQVPIGKSSKNFAVEFPTVKPGQIIVLPKHITNAPRTWRVGAALNWDASLERYIADLREDILGIYRGEKYDDFVASGTGSEAFAEIVPESRRSSDEVDPLTITGENGIQLSLNSDWVIVFPDGFSAAYDPDEGYPITFSILEDIKLLRQLKQLGNDLVFEGDTIYAAVKKITAQYFDVIQYVDEFGFYNVRPRYASKVAQNRIYTLKASQDMYPKLLSSKMMENASQTINRVVLIGKSPGLTEVVIVTVSDLESIRRYGVKQDFVKMNKIDDVIDAIKTAKKRLMGFRQKIRQAEVVCEPILDLRPGHTINVYDISGGLAGPYLITNVGINYNKNGGAVQTFRAYSIGDFYNTDDLSGQVVYFSKEDGDRLKRQRQYSEDDIKKGKHLAQKSGRG